MLAILKQLFLFSMLLGLSFSYAQDTSEACQVSPRDETVVPISCTNQTAFPDHKYKGSRYPVWWSRPNPCPDSDDYYYSCDDMINIRLNLSDGTQELIPGQRDAVPFPDCSLLSVSGNNKSFKIFESDVVEPRKENLKEDVTEPLLEDFTMEHAYQSIATLHSDENSSTYRVLIDDDNGGVVYKDYRVRVENGQKVVDTSNLEEEPKPICQSLTINENGESIARSTVAPGIPAGFKHKLPMMSKDGSLLSAFDPLTQTTKIYRINQSDPTKCEQILDTGIATGKPAFSYDGNEIAFHTTSEPGNDGWFMYEGRDTPRDRKWNTDTWTSGIYTFNLDTKQMRQISTRNPDNSTYGSSYYPEYKQDGSLVFMRANGEYKTNEKYDYEKLEPSFEVVSISREEINRQPEIPSVLAFDSGCQSRNDFASLVALGLLWKDICTYRRTLRGEQVELEATNDNELALIALNLDGDKCRNQVANMWESYERKEAILNAQANTRSDISSRVTTEEYEGLTQDDLLAACPD